MWKIKDQEFYIDEVGVRMDRFKKLLGEMTKDILPKLGQGWEKISSYFEQFFRDFDIQILNVRNLLQDTKRELKKFLAARDQIKRELDQKELEIERLRKELYSIQSNKQHQVYQKLHQELTTKLDELFEIQNKYFAVEEKINEHQQKILELEQEKKASEAERKRLRQEYEDIQKAYQQKDLQLKELSSEIEALKEKERYYESLLENNVSQEETEQIKKSLVQLQVEYQQREEERQFLQQEFDSLQKTKKKLEGDLLSKTLQINKLNSNLIELQQLVDQVNKEKTQYMNALADTEANLKQTQQHIEYYQNQLVEKENQRVEIEKRIESLVQNKLELEEMLQKQESHLTEIMSEYDVKINQLENDLNEQQQENSMLSYQHEMSKSLSEDERKTLEREYEPRFRQIYPNMIFTPQFFQDFFHLTVSDRIKVESNIALLHYRFDTVDSKIRTNTVKTKIGAVAEFPFSQEGRIYFKRQDNVIYIYRLNRTKNEQHFVIKWLQTSLQ